MAESPSYSGLACEENQSIKHNCMDCLEGFSKQKET